MGNNVVAFPRKEQPLMHPLVDAVMSGGLTPFVMTAERGQRIFLTFEFDAPVPTQAAFSAAIIMRDRFDTDPVFRDAVIEFAAVIGASYRAPEFQPVPRSPVPA